MCVHGFIFYLSNKTKTKQMERQSQLKCKETGTKLRTLSKRICGHPPKSNDVLPAGTYYIVPYLWLKSWRDYITGK